MKCCQNFVLTDLNENILVSLQIYSLMNNSLKLLPQNACDRFVHFLENESNTLKKQPKFVILNHLIRKIHKERRGKRNFDFI